MKLARFSLLTDENIDAAVVAFLRAKGFNVRDVKEDGLIGTEDQALPRLAVSENRVALTHDSDFGTLAVAAQKPYVGIVYLRPGHIKPEFTIGTLRTLFIQNPDVNPPFIVVAARSGDVVRRTHPSNSGGGEHERGQYGRPGGSPLRPANGYMAGAGTDANKIFVKTNCSPPHCALALTLAAVTWYNKSQ